jgi:hypothetical protein
MPGKWGKKSKEVVGGSSPVKEDKPERISNKLEHVLVAESKQRPAQQLKRLAVSNKRYLRVVGITVLGLTVLTAGALYLGRDKSKAPAASSGPKCTYQMLEAAKPNFVETKLAQLEPQAKEVEKIAGYDQDVNCLYVVLTYYIYLGEAQKSRELYTKLANSYKPGEGYETIIADVAKPPEQLEPTITFLENQSKKYQKLDAAGGMEGVR